MIRFKDRYNYLELDIVMQDMGNAQSRGDTCISIKLHSNGYAGYNEIWVFYGSLCKFCSDLIKLEEKRKGEAILVSMSPGELYLQIFSIDSFGHMGVRGTTSSQVFQGTHIFPHSVTFGFEFDPSQIEMASQVDWVQLHGAAQPH